MPTPLPLFDLSAGENAKKKGRRLAEGCRNPLLTQLRSAVRAKAISRPDKLATVDDAYLAMAELGVSVDALGSAAGAIFRGDEWEATSAWAKSRRMSNHARMVRVWRLRA